MAARFPRISWRFSACVVVLGLGGCGDDASTSTSGATGPGEGSGGAAAASSAGQGGGSAATGADASSGSTGPGAGGAPSSSSVGAGGDGGGGATTSAGTTTGAGGDASSSGSGGNVCADNSFNTCVDGVACWGSDVRFDCNALGLPCFDECLADYDCADCVQPDLGGECGEYGGCVEGLSCAHDFYRGSHCEPSPFECIPGEYYLAHCLPDGRIASCYWYPDPAISECDGQYSVCFEGIADRAACYDTEPTTMDPECEGCFRWRMGTTSWKYSPTWDVLGVAIVPAPVYPEDPDSLRTWLEGLFEPTHAIDAATRLPASGTVHAGPYDGELDALLAAAGLGHAQSFDADQFDFRNGLVLLVELGPTAAGPVGSSFESPSGPIIPAEKLPFAGLGHVQRSHTFYDNDPGTWYPLSLYAQAGEDGVSHLFMVFTAIEGQGGFLSIGGEFNFNVEIYDSASNSWRMHVPFVVE